MLRISNNQVVNMTSRAEKAGRDLGTGIKEMAELMYLSNKPLYIWRVLCLKKIYN